MPKLLTGLCVAYTCTKVVGGLVNASIKFGEMKATYQFAKKCKIVADGLKEKESE